MDKLKGMNHSSLKSRNRGIALRMIASGRCARADIAQSMSLTKMAISKIVGELIEEGYLTERTTDSGNAVGRTPMLLDISDGAPLAIGVYISRNEIHVLLCDLKLHSLYERCQELRDETGASLLEKIFSLCDDVIAYYKTHCRKNALLGFGVSAISPLDPVTGTILAPTNFFGISNVPVTVELTKRYGYPAYLDNDMNVSALAENIYGCGKNRDCFLYLGITNGIGAGAVLNGRLFSNNSISVGEIGHMSINFNGPKCFCGNRGCLELYSDINVIMKRLRETSGDPSLRPEDIGKVAGEQRCKAVLEDVMEKLAVALINAVNLLDPECVVIGHEGAYLPDGCYSFLEEKINRGILAAKYKTVKVIRSHFADRAPHLGSACLLFEKLFAGEL